jgi:isopenicillin-N synthase
LLELPFNEVPQWPEETALPEFKAYFTKYYTLMTNLAKTLLRGFALAAGKEENFFADKLSLDDCMSTFRLNHYPFLDNIDAIEIAPDGTKIGNFSNSIG